MCFQVSGSADDSSQSSAPCILARQQINDRFTLGVFKESNNVTFIEWAAIWVFSLNKISYIVIGRLNLLNLQSLYSGEFSIKILAHESCVMHIWEKRKSCSIFTPLARPMQNIPRRSWILDSESTPWIPDYFLLIPNFLLNRFPDLDYNGFNIARADFQIPKPRISDSTDKYFLDSGIQITSKALTRNIEILPIALLLAFFVLKLFSLCGINKNKYKPRCCCRWTIGNRLVNFHHFRE